MGIRKCFAATFLVVVSISSVANAEVVSVDWQGAGDGSITRDTESGFDWLDLTETQGLSYVDVIAEMGAGGDYAEWRYATQAEFTQLVLNWGYEIQDSSNCGMSRPGINPNDVICDWNSGQTELVETMINTLGDTEDAYLDAISYYLDASPTGATFSLGILWESAEYDPSVTGSANLAMISSGNYVYRLTGLPYSDETNFVASMATSTGINSMDVAGGSFLVKTNEFYVAPVPVPAAAWLFGSGLIGLIGIAKRKKNT